LLNSRIPPRGTKEERQRRQKAEDEEPYEKVEGWLRDFSKKYIRDYKMISAPTDAHRKQLVDFIEEDLIVVIRETGYFPRPDALMAVASEMMALIGMFETDAYTWAGRILQTNVQEQRTSRMLAMVKRIKPDLDFKALVVPDDYSQPAMETASAALRAGASMDSDDDEDFIPANSWTDSDEDVPLPPTKRAKLTHKPRLTTAPRPVLSAKPQVRSLNPHRPQNRPPQDPVARRLPSRTSNPKHKHVTFLLPNQNQTIPGASHPAKPKRGKRSVPRKAPAKPKPGAVAGAKPKLGAKPKPKPASLVVQGSTAGWTKKPALKKPALKKPVVKKVVKKVAKKVVKKVVKKVAKKVV
jgi:hypothetical protein